MFKRFITQEDGGQVVEYALIIAVVSIALVLALQPLLLAGSFDNFISRFSRCLTTGPCA